MGGRRKIVEHILAERAFLGDVLEQVLAENLPAHLFAGPLGDGAAACPGFAADRDGQAARQSRSLRIVPAKAVQRRYSVAGNRRGGLLQDGSALFRHVGTSIVVCSFCGTVAYSFATPQATHYC